MTNISLNNQSIITDHLDSKDNMYMRTMVIFLQDDPNGYGTVNLCAPMKDNQWEHVTFHVEANVDTARLPYLLEAIATASKWLTINPSFWIPEGEKLGYIFKTSGGKAEQDAANELTKQFNRTYRTKRSKYNKS